MLSDVTLGNLEWLAAQPMARARELRFSVRLLSSLSLLTEEVRVPCMKLTGTVGSFVRDSKGRANWRFGKGGGGPPEHAGPDTRAR